LGRAGHVRVWYSASRGPEESGFRAISDIGADPRSRGFPIFRAEVSSEGHGYENFLGWVQAVAHLAQDGSLDDWSPDTIPALRKEAVPYAAFGYLPTFFDTPFWPERPRLHWRADAFLCSFVIRSPSTEPIEPILGFRWGFRIAEDGREPELLPLDPIGRREWSDILPRLRSTFPDWRFADWPEPRP
jgi:hypothetical protein